MVMFRAKIVKARHWVYAIILLPLCLQGCLSVEKAYTSVLHGFLRAIIPNGVDIDGGAISVLVEKDAGLGDTAIHKAIVNMDLAYASWPNSIDAKLDSVPVTSVVSFRPVITPGSQHVWQVQANFGHGVPAINKTIRGVSLINITSPSMFDSVVLPLTITWSTGSDTGNKALMMITPYDIDTTDTCTTRLFEVPDNGLYTLTAATLGTYALTCKITVFRIIRDIDLIDNKNYLFANVSSSSVVCDIH
jgi:hypothetical protein